MKKELKKALSPVAESSASKWKKGDLKPGAHRTTPGDPAKFVGWVNQHGVEFPVGKYEKFHVSTFGDVILPKCPNCGPITLVTVQVQGRCPECYYSVVDELNAITG